jgi:hypothetical protein
MAFEVAFSDLRRVVNRLLDHAQEKLGSDVLIVEEDYYYHIPEDWRYQMYSPPGQPDIGSLHDDWEFCRTLVDPENEPVSLLLDELAPLLSYIGLRVRE